MNDHILFDYLYIPGFMVLVVQAIAILIITKYTIGGLMRKDKIMNPSLTELSLVIVITGQIFLYKVN